MSKYYYGFFRDRENTLYKVIIITDFQLVDRDCAPADCGEITLASEPFIVEYESEENNLYKPYKCSTATISMMLDFPIPEFNDSSGNNVFVALLKSNNVSNIELLRSQKNDTNCDVVWAGFATPNAYSQPFENESDVFQLECQDALSTLQYYDMKRYVVGGYISFKDVLMRMFAKLRCITEVYITDAIQTEDNKSALNVTGTELNNWYDEDDEAEKMLDVLSEIMQYYSLTCIQVGNAIFIINYDAVISDSHSALTYSFYYNRAIEDYNAIYYDNNENDADCFKAVKTSEAELSHKIDVDKSYISAGNTSISLGSVFNRAKVISKFYDYPDKQKEISSEVDIFSNKVWEKSLQSVRSDHGVLGNSIDDSVYLRPYRGTNPIDSLHIYYSKNGWSNNNITFCEYYNKRQIRVDNGGFFFDWVDVESPLQFYIYDIDKLTQIGSSVNWKWVSQSTTRKRPTGDCMGQWNLQAMRENNGAFLFRHYNNSFNGESEGRNWENRLMSLDAPTLQLSIGMCGYRSANNNIVSENYPKNERETNRQIYLEYDAGVMTLTQNTMLVINGKITFYAGHWTLPASYGNDDKVSGDDNYIYARLQFGDLYYNSDSESWQTEPVDCKIYLSANDGSTAFGQAFKFQNGTINWASQYNGFAVKSPGAGVSGNVKVTLYRPFGLAPKNYAQLSVIDDFGISLVADADDEYTLANEEEKTDNEYCNSIYDSAVEDYDDVEFKITTGDARHNANYSNCIVLGENKMMSSYINKATDVTDIAERQMLTNLINQYSTPSLLIDINLYNNLNIMPFTHFTYHFFNDKIFVLDSWSIDYEKSRINCKLLEKKKIQTKINIIDKEVNRDFGRNGRLL